MPAANLHIELPGHVVLVTGGARGIGREITERFLAAGATVVICGRTQPAKLPSAGGRDAEFLSCDVRDAQQVGQLMEELAARHGRLDVLINNAGGSPQAEAATASPRFSAAIINLNLLAPLYLAQSALPLMQAQPEGGCIVNIASVSGQRPSPGTAAYGAAKAGLLNLTQSLAQEWGPKIRVNAIVVGLMETETTELTYGSAEAQQAIAASLPMSRMGRGSDVANAALFLASPMAAYISGAHLQVHGGGERPLFLEFVERFRSPTLPPP